MGDKSLESLRFPHIQVLIAKYYLFKSIYVSKWLWEEVVTLFVPILITFRMIKREVFLSFPEQIWSHFRVMRISGSQRGVWEPLSENSFLISGFLKHAKDVKLLGQNV